MIKKLLVLLSIGFSGATTAHDGNDGWVTSQGFTLWSNTHEQPEIRISTEDGIYNPKQCSDPDSYMVSTQLSEAVQQRIYSMLLSAVMANKSVRLRIDSSSCERSRPKILNATIN